MSEGGDGRCVTLRKIALLFFILGMTAFGGPAMIRHIRRRVVDERGWLDEVTFDGAVALCQMVPGATAMQLAACVGYRLRGAWGAASAFAAFAAPAFVIMTLCGAYYGRASATSVVAAALAGLRVAVVAIMAEATVTMGRLQVKGWRGALVAAAAAALFGLRVNPAAVVALAAAAGWLLLRPARLKEPGAPPPTAAALRRALLPAAALLLVAVGAFALPALTAARLPTLAALGVRADLFAFGGGFASVPILYHEIVETRGWLDTATFMNGIALGQVTPGPIVITATFVGYLVAGLAGAVVATVGIFLPSFLIVTAVVPVYDSLRASGHFRRAVGGVLYSFVGMLLAVTARFALAVPWDFWRVAIGAGAFVALFFGAPLPWVVVGAVVISAFVL